MNRKVLWYDTNGAPAAGRLESAGVSTRQRELRFHHPPDRTWLPFRAPFIAPAGVALLIAALTFPAAANGASLKSETIAAWDEYLRTANAKLQDRALPGGVFLWTFESTERATRVRSGEIVVAPVTDPNPKKVPGGLIHHWVGAMFLPNVKLDEVLEVTRDYDHYKDYYRPSVTESKSIAHKGLEDEFSMVILNKTLFFKTALTARYHSGHVRVDDCRVYSISNALHIQEIEKYGQQGEHLVPEGDGGTYLWKLQTIARLQQQEGEYNRRQDPGVYYEFDTMALTREIPMPVPFVVEPIVRRLARDSILTSLQKTREAVRRSVARKHQGQPVGPIGRAFEIQEQPNLDFRGIMYHP